MNNRNFRIIIKKILFNLKMIFSSRLKKLYKLEKVIDNFKVKITAIDIGASYFPHTKWGLLKRSKNTSWLAIDPNKKNLNYVEFWNYKSQINLIDKAVGSKSEKRILYTTNIDSGSSLLKIKIPFNSKHRVTLKGIFPIKEYQISTISIENVLGKLNINESSLIIKLDTQGTEFDIVKSLFKTKFKKSLLAVELENNILIEPIYQESSETFEILKFFKNNNFEVISLNVVTSIYPKANKTLKQKNIPSECDWVFMKKFEILCNSDFTTQINALKIYITYNLYGEALSLINYILDKNNVKSNERELLFKIKSILI